MDFPMHPGPTSRIQPSLPEVNTILTLAGSTPTSDTPQGDASSADSGSELPCQLGERRQSESGKPPISIKRFLNGRDKEWAAVAEKPGPLKLLDLPLDILNEIVKEVTHTNDLTSLALCHSTLHALTIPHIYKRFDIVWPESEPQLEPRAGVDALTYGLATLVFADDLFGEGLMAQPIKTELQPSPCAHCGHINEPVSPKPDLKTEVQQLVQNVKRRRRGNHYAQYTRKFSLGNGPADWVKEYMITKEGGKMLGTLVALAVARMRNLEMFTWDMPTGVLRDVWIALSSLGDRRYGQECRLEKLWIRWHNNSSQHEAIQRGPVQRITITGGEVNVESSSSTRPSTSSADVELPTFSIVPPIKSLTVLDIDELAYLDEMSVLIGNSRSRLRELRIGMATHVATCDWVAPWQGEGAEILGTGDSAAEKSIGERRIGGVLGTLMSKCFSTENTHGSDKDTSSKRTGNSSTAHHDGSTGVNSSSRRSSRTSLTSPDRVSPRFVEDLPPIDASSESNHVNQNNGSDAIYSHVKRVSTTRITPKVSLVRDRLRLSVLELERVPLSVSILREAIDWSQLTDLTILNCQNNEQLWKMLRRQYTPRRARRSLTNSSPTIHASNTDIQHIELGDYQLSLRKIQTDQVSNALISFLKESLAPNSLEVLFLQEQRAHVSNVSIDAIFRGPLRRHRASLKKVLIDSSVHTADGQVTNNPRWSTWMLNREIIGFITSGKMPSLRELGAAIDYRDWHYFLQRLPSIPCIRSLYIPFIRGHAQANSIEVKELATELAMQIVDIVTLRPEIQICYMGILTKCFEILEGDYQDRREEFETTSFNNSHAQGGIDDEDDDGDDDDDDDLDENDDPDDELDGGDGTVDVEEDTEAEEDSLDNDEESDLEEDADKTKLRFRLREILYYDDKVAIFKARHGKL